MNKRRNIASGTLAAVALFVFVATQPGGFIRGLSPGKYATVRLIISKYIKATLLIPRPTKAVNMLLERQFQKKVLERQI